MAYRYNIDASGGAFTALTIDGSCTPGERSLTIYAGPANNKWEEIIEDAALDNDKLRLTASTNSSSSSRSGYGKIMYKINGNTCSEIIHLVQAGAAGCSCSDITSFPTTYGSDFTFVTFTQGATSMTITYTETCEMYIENEVSDWLTVTKETSDLKFTVTGQTTDYRSGTVFIRPSSTGDVCKTIVVQQYPNDCTITFNMDEYQPNYIDPDFMVNSCDGGVGGQFIVYAKSDHTTILQPTEQDIERALRYLPDASPNMTEDDKVYEYEYDGTDWDASYYEGVYIQAPCENPSTVCVRLGGYDSGYPDYDVNHHTWVEITDGSSKEYRSLTIEALIRTWNGSPDTYTEEWVTVTAFHEYILHTVGSGDSAFQVGDQVISFRCGTVHGPNGTIPVDMSCSSGCN